MTLRSALQRLVDERAPTLRALAFAATRRVVARSVDAPRGLNLLGYLRGNNGLGVSARAIARALAESDLPHAFVNVPRRSDRDTQAPMVTLGEAFPYAVSVVHVNPRPLPAVLRACGHGGLLGRKLVGIWFWELERVPTAWRMWSRGFDEIWAGSHWNHRSFARQLNCPVRHMPMPLDALVLADAERAAPPLALPDLPFVFLTQFNARSGIDRKNPRAALDAYCTAFPHETGETLFVLKSLHGGDAPEQLAALRARAGGRGDVLLFDGDLSTAQMNALLDRADCFVSLHRSEGFGLGIVEAWSRGKAVIFTDYSGPSEFRDLPGMHAVRYRRVRVETRFRPYRGGGEWAKPEVAHAAALLREVAARGRVECTPRTAPPGYSSLALRDFLRERVAALTPQ